MQRSIYETLHFYCRTNLIAGVKKYHHHKYNQKGYKYGTTDILALLLAMKPFLQNARFSHLVGKVDYALNQKLRRRINKESFDYVANTMGLIGDWKKIKDM